MADWIFENEAQVVKLRADIIADANNKIDELLSDSKRVELLKSIKFRQVGYDTILKQKTNFIEQVNQTFTYLVSLQAIEYLMQQFPDNAFRANFGVKSGYDVESLDGTVICECFAATTPNSNNKLKKDAERMASNTTASYKYVIYYAEQDKPKHRESVQSKYPDVNIVALQSLSL